jgi:hypothetical protein
MKSRRQSLAGDGFRQKNDWWHGEVEEDGYMKILAASENSASKLVASGTEEKRNDQTAGHEIYPEWIPR